jgi:hypothetical protein
VDIDEARRDGEACSVNHLTGAIVDLSNRDDSAVPQRNVGAKSGGAGAIDDASAADEKIEIGHGAAATVSGDVSAVNETSAISTLLWLSVASILPHQQPI